MNEVLGEVIFGLFVCYNEYWWVFKYIVKNWVLCLVKYIWVGKKEEFIILFKI